MADYNLGDSNFRAQRGRDTLMRDNDDAGRDAAHDPLAELARLIGQADPAPEYRTTRHEPRDVVAELAPGASSAPDAPWAAEPDYAEADYAEPDYAQPLAYEEDRYAQPPGDRYVEPGEEPEYAAPRLAEPDLPDGRYAACEQEQGPLSPPIGRYSDQPDEYDDPRGEEPQYDPRYPDEIPPARAAGRAPPPLAPHSDDEDYAEEDGQWPETADGRSAYADGYADDDGAPRPRSRRGVLVMAVAGLVLFGGAASVFAYRSIYGGSLLPTLPPIIKAGDGPIKINPAHGDTQADPASRTAVGNGDSGVKLVTRQEQPVDVQPPNAGPRVVQTIPVMPGTPSQAPVVAPASAPGAITAPGASPFPPPPALSSFPPPAALPTVVPPTPPAAAGPPVQASSPPAAEPKKVHTVSIRPAEPAAGAHVATAGPLPITHTGTTSQPPARTSLPETRTGTAAPLSLVPSAPGETRAAEPPRTQVARTEPRSAPLATTPSSTASTGGYAVQVTSQRSQAEAEAAFRSLRAKYPGQIGSRVPIIRRADLGDKGTFYRALVGPFGSHEEAAQVCSSLKAAGGSCLVQAN